MATLTSDNIDEIYKEVMEEFSRQLENVPVTKTKLRAGIVNVDVGINSSESAIFSGITDADVRTWLQNNQDLGRYIMELVIRKRKEVL